MLRWPHAHHRDLRARLPAAPPTIDDTCLHQNRHLMITAFRLRQRRADLPSRWSSTGCDETYPNAPCQQQNGPAMATPGGYLNCHLPLPPTRPIIARPRAHCEPSHAPSSSLKDAMRRTKARRSLFAHSFVHHHVEETANGSCNRWYANNQHCPLRCIGAQQEHLALSTPASRSNAAEPASDQRWGYRRADGEAHGSPGSLGQDERQSAVDRALLRGWIRCLLVGTVPQGTRH